MKKNISAIIASVSCVLLIICLYNISSLKKEVDNLKSNLYSRISDIDRSISMISYDVKKELESQASLLSDGQWAYGDIDFENYTVSVNVSVTPKEYTPDKTSAVIVCGKKEYPMTLSDGAYIADIELSFFENSIIDSVLFEKEGTVQTESLNWEISPRYDCLPIVYAENGSSTGTVKNGFFIWGYDDGICIIAEQKNGNIGEIGSISVLAYSDGVLSKKFDIPVDQEKMQRHDVGFDYFIEFKNEFKIPFESKFELYTEVEIDGLYYRNKIEEFDISSNGSDLSEGDWFRNAEGSIYDADGNIIFDINAVYDIE